MSDLKKYAEELVRLCATEVQQMLVEFHIPIVQDDLSYQILMQQQYAYTMYQNMLRRRQYAHHTAQIAKHINNYNIAHMYRTRQK